MRMEVIGLMFKKSARQNSTPNQFKNGPNYVALVLSFVPLIIALFAPVDRGTHIYLVIFAGLGFVIGSENDRINENGIYRYLLFFPVRFFPWERVEQVSHTLWDARTAYVISSKGCRRFEKHSSVIAYWLRYPFRALIISGFHVEDARPLILKYFGAIDFEEDEMTP